jgi:hypothetical protein
MIFCAIHDLLWGAQATSLQFAAACREHLIAFTRSLLDNLANAHSIRPASCRAVQAGSLRSPDRINAH